MTRRPRLTLTRVLRRLCAVAALTAFVFGLNVAVPSAAHAATVYYTMTCNDWWKGETTRAGDDYGQTVRWQSQNSECGSHYAWVNIHYANSSGSGSTGKRQSSGEAGVGVPETLRFYRVGAHKSWHSGCGSGCHTEWTYA